MENFKMVEVKDAPRVELHNLLGLTGCEISINELPAKAAVPFVHAHKQNEEVYGVLGGKGQLYIDGQVVDIKAGDWFVIRLNGHRTIHASDDEGIKFICIQTKSGSLREFTAGDAIILEEKAPWLK